jgi:hypothetical protein
MPGSDSSQYTAFKRYSSALVNPRTDNKSISHFYTFNPRAPASLGSSKFLSSISKSSSSSVILTAVYNGVNIGSLKIIGYTLLTITQQQIDSFKNALAILLNISPSLITINLTPGSLIIDFQFSSSEIDVSILPDNDKAFIINCDSILRQLDITDFSDIVNSSGTNSVITGTPTSIDSTYSEIAVDINLVNECKNTLPIITFTNPLVGDPNDFNFMYTIVQNDVVRIDSAGTVTKIATFPESNGCRYIYICNSSSFLLIPSNVLDTTLSGAHNSDLVYNKFYVIDLSNGIVYTKTLSNNIFRFSNMFNQFNNRVYFTSYMQATYNIHQFFELTNPFLTETVTSIQTTTNFSANGLNVTAGVGKTIFVNSTTCYLISKNISIKKFSINASGTSVVTGDLIAGYDYDIDRGTWLNGTIPGYFWPGGYDRLYVPYRDNSVGTDAFFSFIYDISYDVDNNRLLVCDIYAQRIRCVDLTPGNNYAVTTLAGTSPILYGKAANVPGYTNLSPTVLASLGQVGVWGNAISGMPAFSKVNSTYLTSTFYSPSSIIAFIGKIYVNDAFGIRQLYNGRVSDFTGIKGY